MARRASPPYLSVRKHANFTSTDFVSSLSSSSHSSISPISNSSLLYWVLLELEVKVLGATMSTESNRFSGIDIGRPVHRARSSGLTTAGTGSRSSSNSLASLLFASSHVDGAADPIELSESSAALSLEAEDEASWPPPMRAPTPWPELSLTLASRDGYRPRARRRRPAEHRRRSPAQRPLSALQRLRRSHPNVS